MTTINGVTFNMRNLEPISIVRNVPNDQPGSDENFVTHMGYKGLVLRLTGFEKTLAAYDNVIKEFMKVGEQTLVHRTGWQFKVHSAQLNPVLLEGSPNNYFPYTLTLITSTPYRESTSETTRSKTITTNNQTWTQDDSANDIDTDGSVDAIPDIKVTGNGTPTSILQETDDTNYNVNNSGNTVTISEGSSNNSSNVNSTNSRGQTFDSRKAGQEVIDSITVVVDTVTVAGNITCGVYDKPGGILLGSKVLNITTTGMKTFTFTTPIAVVQDENTCSDGTDSKRMYFKLSTTGSVNIWFDIDTGNPYADGAMYHNDSPYVAGYDMTFQVIGHSCKEVRQTFTVPDTRKLTKVTLELCKYNYGGTNPLTVEIKDGSTVLGTGVVVLSGSTFKEFEIYIDEESDNSLDLVTGTTYTMSITPPSNSAEATSVLIKTNTTSVYANGAVTLVEDGDTTRAQTHDLWFNLHFAESNYGVEIYNTADTSVKCKVADVILKGAIHRINTDGTGTVDYDDDFTTTKWAGDSISSGVTHDTVDDELDIADDGYIFWKCDTKYTVTGIPTLTSRINITAGTPTIQISSNGTTWYDITTAIVDDVETVYELDSNSLHLKGLTEFYWRFDCVKAAAATASIKTFELDVNIVTIDVEHPKISESGVSTIRCDQDDSSGMNSVVALIYHGRSWAI